MTAIRGLLFTAQVYVSMRSMNVWRTVYEWIKFIFYLYIEK